MSVLKRGRAAPSLRRWRPSLLDLPLGVTGSLVGLVAGTITERWLLGVPLSGLTAIVPAVMAAAAAGGLAVVIVIAGRRQASALLAERIASISLPPREPDLIEVIREELEDSGARLLYRLIDSDVFVDGRGALAELSETWIVVVDEVSSPIVVLEIGRRSVPAPWRLRAVVSGISIATQNARLQALRLAAVRRLAEERAALVRSAVEQRRTLEARLHDGAQSSMFAALAEVARARAVARDSPFVTELETTSAELLEAVQQLRLIVRGRIFPSALRESGLLAALEVAGEQLPLQVEVRGAVARDVDEGAELAAYLSVVDVLQGAVRAGSDHADVHIAMDAGELITTVRLQGDVPLPPIVNDRTRGLGGAVDVAVEQNVTVVHLRPLRIEA